MRRLTRESCIPIEASWALYISQRLQRSPSGRQALQADNSHPRTRYTSTRCGRPACTDRPGTSGGTVRCPVRNVPCRRLWRFPGYADLTLFCGGQLYRGFCRLPCLRLWLSLSEQWLSPPFPPGLPLQGYIEIVCLVRPFLRPQEHTADDLSGHHLQGLAVPLIHGE